MLFYRLRLVLKAISPVSKPNGKNQIAGEEEEAMAPH